MGNQSSKTIPFIGSPQAKYTNYQNTIANSTSIVVIRIIYFTIVHCFLFINLFSLYFQVKDSDTHADVHSWSPNDGDRNQPTFGAILLIACIH